MSRDVVVPVSPLSVIREHGAFVPIFVCGWNSNPLSLNQRRLLATISDDAFLSLTDFQKSPAEFLFFPKVGEGEDRKREPEVWQRGDYELLPKPALDRCVEIFLTAREAARTILLEEIAKEDERRRREGEPSEVDRPERSGDLFSKK